MSQKIMVVDDDPTMLKMAETTLKMRGFEVVTAKDGREACDRARTERPGMIIMDLRMPGMDGKTAIDHLKNDPATSGIPILMISGMPPESLQAGPDGTVGFLSKPFPLADLAQRIRITLAKTGTTH